MNAYVNVAQRIYASERDGSAVKRVAASDLPRSGRDARLALRAAAPAVPARVPRRALAGGSWRRVTDVGGRFVVDGPTSAGSRSRSRT